MTRKKKLILSFLALCTLGLTAKLALYFYLNSESARILLVEKLNKDSRKITIQDHNFSFFTGITVSGLKMTDNKSGETREFDIPSASLNYNHFFYFRALPAFQTLQINDAELYISKFKKSVTKIEPKTPAEAPVNTKTAPEQKKELVEIPELLTGIQVKNMKITINDEGKESSFKGLDLSFNTESDFNLKIKEISFAQTGLANLELQAEASSKNFQTILALIVQESLKEDYHITKLKQLDSPIEFNLTSQAASNGSPLSKAFQINADSSLNAEASFDTNQQIFDISKLTLNSGNISLKASGQINVKDETLKLDLEQLPANKLALKVYVTGSFDKAKYKSNNHLLNKLVFDKL